MNVNEPAIGPLMKAARKFKKFNQSDVANAIGCSQSALSKMEHNLLIPNAPQWFLFSRFTAIPPETIENGIIDRHSTVKLNDDSVSLGYKLPKRYRLNRAQKVRQIYPFFSYLEKQIDGIVFKEFMMSVGIDPEFFLDFDNIVSIQLVVDLINLYSSINRDSPEEIKKLVQFGQDDLYWDSFIEQWSKLSSAQEVLEAFAQEQKFFQADFVIKVQHPSGVLTVSYIPENHLYHFLKDVGPQVKTFIASYRKETIVQLLKLTLGKDVDVRIIPILSTSAMETHLEIHS